MVAKAYTSIAISTTTAGTIRLSIRFQMEKVENLRFIHQASLYLMDIRGFHIHRMIQEKQLPMEHGEIILLEKEMGYLKILNKDMELMQPDPSN